MLIIAIYEDQKSQLKVSYQNYNTCKLFDPKITGDKLVPDSGELLRVVLYTQDIVNPQMISEIELNSYKSGLSLNREPIRFEYTMVENYQELKGAI